MRQNSLSQLVGALGGRLQERPYKVDPDARDRAARIILDMKLLGVSIDDVDAPELIALDPEDREVVEQARVWALARREEASRRERAEERAVAHRRQAERNASANASETSARPALSPEPIVDVRDVEQPDNDRQEGQSQDTPLAFELAEPADHELFTVPPLNAVPALTRLRRIKPDAAFKVVIVVWGIAALGMVVVVVRLILG